MKSRVLMLFVGLFAVTPALFGTAWGIENRSKHGTKQECERRGAKPFELVGAAAKSLDAKAAKNKIKAL